MGQSCSQAEKDKVSRLPTPTPTVKSKLSTVHEGVSPPVSRGVNEKSVPLHHRNDSAVSVATFLKTSTPQQAPPPPPPPIAREEDILNSRNDVQSRPPPPSLPHPNVPVAASSIADAVMVVAYYPSSASSYSSSSPCGQSPYSSNRQRKPTVPPDANDSKPKPAKKTSRDAGETREYPL